MGKKERMNERKTYAVKTLSDILEGKHLQEWCLERNLPLSTIYKIAVGDCIPNYSIICNLLPYIPYIDWFYFEDDKIPYERNTIKAWNPKINPSFIKKHRYDWMEQGKHFGLSDTFAKNLFVNHRALPTINMIRQAALEGTDPIEFFIDGEVEYPNKGEIVLFLGKTYLVLSESNWNAENSAFFCVEMKDGKCDILTAGVRMIQRKFPKFVEKANLKLVNEISNQIKNIIV